MSDNRLAASASPYLRQHAQNPVNWREWGREALDEATREGKPILLSIGYAACHWCHVMAHESFEDAATAAVMNDLFVNIKVDREERPDIDHIYMNALHALGEQGGWPLTMFLTASGEPFWGGTYFPKRAAYGRPSFVEVLRSVAAAWRGAPERIGANVAAIGEAVRRGPARRHGAESIPSPADLAPRLAEAFDPAHGGLKGAPKFPNCAILDLLRRGGEFGHATAADLWLLTLRQMAAGGIHDHLAGGFARYSTDAEWLAPHFEKMLYDNALLLEAFAQGWRSSGDEALRESAEGVVRWVVAEMDVEDGAFAASLDADSEGEEGRAYVWTAGELRDILGAEDFAFFRRFFDAPDAGNWHEHGRAAIILRTTGKPAPTGEDAERLKALKSRLLENRRARPQPGRDDKLLADWNGLAIAALAQAGASFGRPDWRALAARAFRQTLARCQRDGRLGHSFRDGRLIFPALSTDYAALARAALVLADGAAPGEAAALVARAKEFIAALDAFHADLETGLYYQAAADSPDVPLRLAPTNDDATPNAHGLLVEAFVRLAFHSDELAWLARADQLLRALAQAAAANPLAHASILNAADFRRRAVEIRISGPAESPLRAAALRLPFAERMVALGDRDAAPSATLCVGQRCLLPVASEAALPAAFAEALAIGRSAG